MHELSFLLQAWVSGVKQMVTAWISQRWAKTSIACFRQLHYFHPIELHLTKAVPCCLDESAQQSEGTDRCCSAHQAGRCAEPEEGWSGFLTTAASSFSPVEASVLRGKCMNGGFMEMSKCNGTSLLFSIPAAGTVTLCVFYQRHERGTISLSAINNMVSFEADYPSVGVKGK